MLPSRKFHFFTAYHREPGGLRRLDFFVARISEKFSKQDSKSIKILDIGCGLGNISLALASLGYRVTGVDLDASSIHEARERALELCLGAVFHEGSFDRVEGQKFDVIIASEVLEHQKDAVLFLASVRNLLKPDGLFLLSVPNGTSLEENIRWFTTHTFIGKRLKRIIKKRIIRETVQSSADHPHEHFYSWRRLCNLMLDQGWKIKEAKSAAAFFKEFFYLIGRYFMRRGSSIFHVLDSIDNWLSSFLPISMGDGWLLEVSMFDKTKPSVMHVVTKLEPGGAEKLVYELVSRLPRLGYSTQAVSIFGSGPLEENFLVNNLPFKIISRRGPLAIWTFFKLKRHITIERPDIVHTHLFGADVMGRVAAWLLRVPIRISTEHSINLDHGFIKRGIKFLLSRITTVFIAVSQEAKRYMIAREGIEQQKVKVIENGIDFTVIKTRSTSSFHDIPRLITVGRLVAQKNHATLFKALAFIKRPWLLQVVGMGPMEESLRKLADRLGIAPRIHWLGFRKDVPDLLAESDVFCFPSKWEGLGLAYLEAMAAGVPVVASDLPVLRQIISDKYVSFATSTDVLAWSRAIEGLLADPVNAVNNARLAREYILQKYSIDTMIASYASLYQECLKGKRKI